MKKIVCLGLFFCVASLPSMATANRPWSTLLKDDFHREMVGPDWRILRGDWRIEDGHLRITRQWQSDSVILNTKPIDNTNVRASMDVILNEQDSMGLFLRTGEILWGGGGKDDRFGIRLRGKAAAPNKLSVVDGEVCVPIGVAHHVVIEIDAGTATASINGQAVLRQKVSPASSEVNRYFGISCIPNGSIDNFHLETRSAPTMVLPLGTAADNQRATVEAARFIDPKNPALGIQKAIDSLPPTGGVVLLPEGTFLMRRHLRLPSNVTLRGRGWNKTILKAVPARSTVIEKVESQDGVAVVIVRDATGFQSGDAVCFGPVWGHPGSLGAGPVENQDLIITSIQNKKLVLSGPAPTAKAATLYHWFPLIYSRATEFVEVKDLALHGEANKDAGVRGDFRTNPITFGCVTGARVSRVHIDTWNGDGFSLQGGSDAIVTDNTVTRVSQGFHPGTTTSRYLWSRNLSTGNYSCGLFFCWYNQNGVYFQNTLDSFAGYADQGDVFNTIAYNRIRGGFGITTGYNGVFVGNQTPSITMDKGETKVGKHLYGLPGRYFILAANRTDKITLGNGVAGNIVAGNRPLNPTDPINWQGDAERNLYTTSAETSASTLAPIGIDRTDPVAPPQLPQPILDGRKYYRPGTADCGFQRALTDLQRAGGGTLLLPGGRYALRQPLILPSKVTLAGQGIGTVLQSASEGGKGPLIVAKSGAGVTIRDLSILGSYTGHSYREPAINISNIQDAQIIAVDIRGWDGSGISVSGGGVQVQDCRAFQCGGDGFRFTGCTVQSTANIANGCRNGFVLQSTLAGARVEGNISAINREAGYLLESTPQLLLLANNANYNGMDGVLLKNVQGAVVAANTVMNSSQSLRDGAGVRLEGATKECQILYNNCSDEQLHPTQLQGIVESNQAGPNTIRFNVTAPIHMRPNARHASSLLSEGKGSTVKDNQTETLRPTGSSVEALAVGYRGS